MAAILHFTLLAHNSFITPPFGVVYFLSNVKKIHRSSNVDFYFFKL